jgi:hypothetical protein
MSAIQKMIFMEGNIILESTRCIFPSAWMTSPPDPLSAMEQWSSSGSHMRRGGKRLTRGLAGRAPFSKKTSPPPIAFKRDWGRGKRGGGKQFEVIGNGKIIALKSVTYVKFPYNLEENHLCKPSKNVRMIVRSSWILLDFPKIFSHNYFERQSFSPEKYF